jgi:hypothetical protein
MGGDCLNTWLRSVEGAACGRGCGAGAAPGLPGSPPKQPKVDFAAAKDHVAASSPPSPRIDSQERFEALGVHGDPGFCALYLGA